jgi:hypothetical protein
VIRIKAKYEHEARRELANEPLQFSQDEIGVKIKVQTVDNLPPDTTGRIVSVYATEYVVMALIPASLEKRNHDTAPIKIARFFTFPQPSHTAPWEIELEKYGEYWTPSYVQPSPIKLNWPRLINNRLIDMANGIVWRKHMKSSSWDGCAVAPWNDEEALAIAYALALPTTPIPLILPVKTIDL